jgi:manganese/zinc/iron transport system permease protein
MKSGRRLFAASVLWLTAMAAGPLLAQSDGEPGIAADSLTDRSIAWPSPEQWRRVILLEDYNTRLVVFGTTLLGCAAGMVGSFTLLRRRALMGDALSHATLPGICLAFMIANWWGSDGKSLLLLLTGATITGLMGVVSILAIRNFTRLKDDTAMGIVLSVYFGAGVALLGVIQQMSGGHAAGLEAFIFGKTASMGYFDALLIAASAAISIGACLLLFKEMTLVCFDESFAGSRGMPVLLLDLCLMGLIIVVTIVGLQAVGLILMIALLVIPPSASRFWTESTWRLFLLSGLAGALCGHLGAAASALFYKLPSGAMIVMVCATFFMFSLIMGTKRGILIRALRRWNVNRNVDRDHLLRAVYEMAEKKESLQLPDPKAAVSEQGLAGNELIGQPVFTSELLAARSWSRRRLLRAIRSAEQAGMVDHDQNSVRLHRRGLIEAVRLTRQHRLWELYLIRYADVATSKVDRDADAIEHILEPEIVAELESLLEKHPVEMPASPHRLALPAVPVDPEPAQGGVDASLP